MCNRALLCCYRGLGGAIGSYLGTTWVLLKYFVLVKFFMDFMCIFVNFYKLSWTLVIITILGKMFPRGTRSSWKKLSHELSWAGEVISRDYTCHSPQLQLRKIVKGKIFRHFLFKTNLKAIFAYFFKFNCISLESLLKGDIVQLQF